MTKDEALQKSIDILKRLDAWLSERNLGGLMPDEKEAVKRFELLIGTCERCQCYYCECDEYRDDE